VRLLEFLVYEIESYRENMRCGAYFLKDLGLTMVTNHAITVIEGNS